MSANTTRAYAQQWARFEAWCAGQGRLALLATAETLAEYATALFRADYAPATIEQAVAAIRVAHRIGHTKPGRQGILQRGGD